MIIRDRTQRRILGQLWQECEPLLSEQPWPQLPAGTLRQIPENSQVILDRLAQTFGGDLLVQYGIAVRDGGGAMTLHQRLAPGTGPLMALTDGADSLPFDLMLPTGLLVGDELSLHVQLHDHRFAADVNTKSGVMLLVPIVQDVVICHALGIAASSVDEINRINIARLRELGAIVGSRSSDSPAAITSVVADSDATVSNSDSISSPAESPQEINLGGVDETVDRIPLPAGLESVDLLITGWSFALRERIGEAQLRPMITRLVKAQQCLSIDFSRIGVWLPTQASIDQLEFCWEFQDCEAVVAAIFASMRHDCHELSSVLNREIAPVRAPQTFLEARSALRRSIQDGYSSEEERRQAVANYGSQVERDITEPMQRRGMTHQDPVVGMLMVEFGNIASKCQLLTPFLQDRLTREMTSPGRQSGGDEFDRGEKLYLQLTDRLIRIGREIRRK